MTLQRYADGLRRWLWLIVLGVLLSGAAGRIVSERQPKVYEASVRLLVNPDSAPGTPPSSDLLDRLAATYSEMLLDQPVLQETVAQLKLPISPAELKSLVKVDQVRGTSLLELQVQYSNPQTAAAIADEIPKAFDARQLADDRVRAAAAQASMQTQLQDVQTEIGILERSLASLQASPASDPSAIARQQAQLSALQTGYNQLYQQYAAQRTQQIGQTPPVTPTSLATALPIPIRPNTTQNTLAAALAGGLLAIGFAFLMEMLDQNFIRREQAERRLLLPVVGTVPYVGSLRGASEVSVLRAAHLPQTEAYRMLRTNVEVASGDGGARVLLIASPNEHEGRSVTAANLAAALAQTGHSVILVDADLHRPRMHKLFKLPNHAGLATALTSARVDVRQLLQPTAAATLRILTSGQLPANPAELLDSAQMRTLIATLSEQADYVILDSPPALRVADATILATEVEGVLLVLDAKSSKLEAALEVLATFRQVHAQLYGVILNRMPKLRATYEYGYYGDYHEADVQVQPGTGANAEVGRKLARDGTARPSVTFRPAEAPAEDTR